MQPGAPSMAWSVLRCFTMITGGFVGLELLVWFRVA